MKYCLGLESIGDDAATMSQAWRDSTGEHGGWYRPWVAEITGTDPTYGLARRFLRYQKDYSRANSRGSRGIYLFFMLDEGPIYEVFAHLAWKNSERYFVQITDGKPRRLEREEVLACLSTSAASASTS